jgi:hypothetical protein
VSADTRPLHVRVRLALEALRAIGRAPLDAAQAAVLLRVAWALVVLCEPQVRRHLAEAGCGRRDCERAESLFRSAAAGLASLQGIALKGVRKGFGPEVEAAIDPRFYMLTEQEVIDVMLGNNYDPPLSVTGARRRVGL